MTMEIAAIANHAQRTIGRLRQMNGPRMQAIAGVLGDRCQELENILSAMGAQRYLANATGATLDAIGALRNIARQGLPDAIYRNVIIGAIAAQTSKGLPENVINAALGLFSAANIFLRTPNSTHADSAPTAVVTIGIGSGMLPASIIGRAINLLSESLGAGIVIDQLFTFDASNAFAMDGPQSWVRGLDVGGLAADVYTNPTE